VCGDISSGWVTRGDDRDFGKEKGHVVDVFEWGNIGHERRFVWVCMGAYGCVSVIIK
jgi:hypothetical protein